MHDINICPKNGEAVRVWFLVKIRSDTIDLLFYVGLVRVKLFVVYKKRVAVS